MALSRKKTSSIRALTRSRLPIPPLRMRSAAFSPSTGPMTGSVGRGKARTRPLGLAATGSSTPIDGTRAFLTGLPSWCVLIALTDETGPVLSVIDQPFTGERFFGTRGSAGLTAHLERNGARSALTTRRTARLSTALGETTDAFLFEGAEWGGVSGRARQGAALPATGWMPMDTPWWRQAGSISSWNRGFTPGMWPRSYRSWKGAGGIVTNWGGRAGPWRRAGARQRPPRPA